MRWEVPVDDRPHTLPLTGQIVHVACRQVDLVEVWSLDDGSGEPDPRTFQVVGTGHAFPDDWQYRGTALSPSGRLVWHLMEVPS